jgi:hypothetical protein
MRCPRSLAALNSRSRTFASDRRRFWSESNRLLPSQKSSPGRRTRIGGANHWHNLESVWEVGRLYLQEITLRIGCHRHVPGGMAASGRMPFFSVDHLNAAFGQVRTTAIGNPVLPRRPPCTYKALAIGEPTQSTTRFSQPYAFEKWQTSIGFLQGRGDHFFALEFQRQVARERLGITLDGMPGGHLLSLSQPTELASRLEAYRTASETLSEEPVRLCGSRSSAERAGQREPGDQAEDSDCQQQAFLERVDPRGLARCFVDGGSSGPVWCRREQQLKRRS